MRATLSRLAGLMVVLLAPMGGTAFGQGLAGSGAYSPPDPQLPIPTWANGNRPEEGGFYTAAEFMMIRQTNPLRNQTIAYRGFVDADGSISGIPGTFEGSGQEALNARNASGPMTYQPGFKIDLGWKFSGEVESATISLSWMFFIEAKYNAQASLAYPFLQSGAALTNTFLFSPVYAFPSDYSGPPFKVAGGDAFAAFGIWNAASLETIQFTQKLQQWDITWRQPYYSTETYRISGLMGARFMWIWENFLWKTFDLDQFGNNGPLDTGVYSNIVSNRMYGPFIGCSQEWYVGHGFACQLDLGTAAFLDVVRELIHYEFADRTVAPQSKLGRRDYTVAFEFTGMAGMAWYPIEGVQLRAGYDLWLLLNSVAAAQPVNFNWGSPAYKYSNIIRTFDGFNVGVALVW